MEKSTSGQSSLFSPETFGDSPSATGSPASESGATRCDSLDGPTINQSGPHHAPVSRSPRRAKNRALRIDDTFSQSCFDSSKNDDLSWSLANRYRLQTASLGSTLFEITWKARRTPSGRLIYAQRARALRTSETVLSSWPTPQAHDMTTRGNTEADHHHKVHDLSKAAALASWATPTVRDHKDGESEGTAPVNALLGRQVWLAGWPTPMAGSPATDTYNEAGNTDSSRKTVALLALSTDSGGNQVGYYADRNGAVEIPVGGPLNPAHSRWQMGLPPEWDGCGVTAMELLRQSRRGSSKRASKKSDS
jgi:hypothetical protein